MALMMCVLFFSCIAVQYCATDLRILMAANPEKDRLVSIESPSDSISIANEASSLTEEEVRAIIDEYMAEKSKVETACLSPREQKERDLQMTAKWNDGLELSTKDKKFRTHIGGRYQLDTAWFSTFERVRPNSNF